MVKRTAPTILSNNAILLLVHLNERIIRKESLEIFGDNERLFFSDNNIDSTFSNPDLLECFEAKMLQIESNTNSRSIEEEFIDFFFQPILKSSFWETFENNCQQYLPNDADDNVFTRFKNNIAKALTCRIYDAWINQDKFKEKQPDTSIFAKLFEQAYKDPSRSHRVALNVKETPTFKPVKLIEARKKSKKKLKKHQSDSILVLEDTPRKSKTLFGRLFGPKAKPGTQVLQQEEFDNSSRNSQEPDIEGLITPPPSQATSTKSSIEHSPIKGRRKALTMSSIFQGRKESSSTKSDRKKGYGQI